MQAYIYSRYSRFSRFIPLSPLAILLWIWYFLIPTRSRLSFVIYRSFSYSVEFYFGLSSRAHWWCYLSYSLHIRIYSFSRSLPPSFPPSLPCQSSSHSFVFIFYFSFSRAPFFSLFVLPLYCTSSPCAPILHYYFLASFFHFVSSHTVFIVPSQFSLNLLDTHHNSQRDGFSFSACHTCIRRA